jgi:allophanate hydrolase
MASMTAFVPRRLTITALREGYRSKAFTPRDVMRAVLRRVEDYEDYHIWIQAPTREELASRLDSLGDVDKADFARQPLWGVPFAVKDNIDVAGMPTTAGCPAFEYLPDHSATVVSRLEAAGALVVGKTNLDQFATGLVGTRSPYGECHNALRPELISGGSSSGSAVAVALGQVAFSLGTDTAGSGRVPAALNGLVGFKPPFGSWSTAGVVPACASLDCVSVFAPRVADAALIDRVVAGYDEDCIWSRPVREDERPPEKGALVLPQTMPRFFGSFAEGYERCWHDAVRRVEDTVLRTDMRLRYLDTTILEAAARVLYEGPWVAERWCDLGAFVEAHPGAVLPVTEKILRGGTGEKHTAVTLFEAEHFLQACRHAMRRELADAVLVLPTTGGTFTRDEARAEPVTTNSLLGLYTNHCNLLDLCALVLPAGQAGERLPFGLTLFALRDRQAALFEAARLLFPDDEYEG